VSAEDKRDPIAIFRQLREAQRIDVRYGRARLTVFRFGGFTEGDLGAAVKRFERGEIDAESLSWVFVRSRVVQHTPSFSWEDAELPLLLDRVVGVSTEPVFEASSPEDVAEVLVEGAWAAREVREELRKSTALLGRKISDQYGFGSGLSPMVASMQRAIGGRFGTFVKAQGIPGLTPKVSDVIGGANRPAMFNASKMIQDTVKFQSKSAKFDALVPFKATEVVGKAIKANFGTDGFDALRLAGAEGKFPSFMRDGMAADLFGRRSPTFARVIDPTLFDTSFKSVIGRDQRFGLADFSAGTAFSKTIKAHGGPTLFRGVGEQFTRINKEWLRRLREAYPSNWHDLERAEVDQVEKLMLDPGICLAWVPRTEILHEILEAEDEDGRTAVLERRSADIVVDVEEVLDEVTLPKLATIVDYAVKAIAAHKDGHTEAALSLAAATLSSIVHDFMGEENFGPVREIFAGVDPHNDVDIQEFAFHMVGKIWVKANQRFEGNADPGFNRNRTLHLVGEHYSEANLIAVLMLLAGLCRELERFEFQDEASESEAPDPALSIA
jgi:hypothetical protein